jgi:hypothetical protein
LTGSGAGTSPVALADFTADTVNRFRTHQGELDTLLRDLSAELATIVLAV